MRHLTCVSILFLLIGCNDKFKQTEAQFNRAQQDVIADLKALHGFDDAKIAWTENQIDEGSSREINENIKWSANLIDDGVGRNLKIYLTNGRNLPETNSRKAEIGRKAMQIVLNSIENASDYEDFTVVFVHEAVYGGMEMSSENPFRYKLEDFNTGTND